jgi:hypothetical protein
MFLISSSLKKSPSTGPSSTPSNIANIPISSSPSSSTGAHKSGLAGGAIAGIVIAVLASLGLAAVLAFCLLRRRRNLQAEKGTGPDMEGLEVREGNNVHEDIVKAELPGYTVSPIFHHHQGLKPQPIQRHMWPNSLWEQQCIIPQSWKDFKSHCDTTSTSLNEMFNHNILLSFTPVPHDSTMRWSQQQEMKAKKRFKDWHKRRRDLMQRLQKQRASVQEQLAKARQSRW